MVESRPDERALSALTLTRCTSRNLASLRRCRLFHLRSQREIERADLAGIGVVRSTTTRSKTFDHSGWWSCFWATSAHVDMNPNASAKPPNLYSRCSFRLFWP